MSGIARFAYPGQDLLPLSRQTTHRIRFPGVSAGALTPGYDLVPLSRH